jgi:ditrans,polycis-polyprenyl diphosphate synthase
MAVPVTTPILSAATRTAYWLRDQIFDRIRRVFFAVLRAGPIPRHVAFIMDGNRRYAHIKGMKVLQGHIDGFVALRKVSCVARVPPLEEGKKGLSSSKLGSGNMFQPRHQIRLCILLFHRQLQAPKRRGRWADAFGRKRAPGPLHTWVRDFLHFPVMVKMYWPRRGLLAQHGIRLNTIGKTDFFPLEVQAALAKAKELTKDNQRWVSCL